MEREVRSRRGEGGQAHERGRLSQPRREKNLKKNKKEFITILANFSLCMYRCTILTRAKILFPTRLLYRAGSTGDGKS